MKIVTIPTEQTTAATDLLLAPLALVTALSILKRGAAVAPYRAGIWGGAFLCLCLAALFGAAAHGLAISPRVHAAIWHAINLALAAMMALFLAAVTYDLAGKVASRNALPWLLGVSAVFFLATVLVPGSFLVFIVYEASAMAVALVAYTLAAARRRLPGAAAIAEGVVLTVLAACIQATGAVRFELVWSFDHNGVFHLIQILALPFFAWGIGRGFAR